MLAGRPNVSSSGRWQHVNERAGLPARSRSAVGVAKHTHTQTHKHTDTQTDTQTDTHTDTHTQTHTHTFCASLRNRNARQHFTRAPLYGNLQEKCCSPKPRPTLCESLRSRNACQHFTRATFYGNLQEECSGPE